jgi:hypothetical protein
LGPSIELIPIVLGQERHQVGDVAQWFIEVMRNDVGKLLEFVADALEFGQKPCLCFLGLLAGSDVFEENRNATRRVVFHPKGIRLYYAPLGNEFAFNPSRLAGAENVVICVAPFLRFARKRLLNGFLDHVAHA